MSRIKRYLAATLVPLLTIVALTNCNGGGSNSSGTASPGTISQHETLSKIQREKKLRVGYIHYPPSAYRGPDGKVSGHFTDTLEEIIRRLDPAIEITYEETTWADFTQAITSGRIDLSIAGTFTTVPRAKVVAFTRPLVYLGRSAIVRKGDDRFSPDVGPEQFDRPDIKVAVVSGEGSHEYVKASFENQENIVVFSGSDLSQALAAVSAGQVDVGMSDSLETQKYARAHPEVADLYGSSPYNLTPIAWAVRHQDTAWKDFLNTAIHTLETQGLIADFENRYDFTWVHPNTEYSTK